MNQIHFANGLTVVVLSLSIGDEQVPFAAQVIIEATGVAVKNFNGKTAKARALAFARKAA